ncbi:hypothetical protein G7062_02460 [Erysipelothrix sp. HDW6C]|uniref:SpaA isopeptide-forming pilin-related protein n=1 Tax=Erysipelothrix sp. HDW6C TaxID=2714930 RepID=UPI001409FF9A|nr:SpaA isopeptide-forming pilin-related protein [Erysipelothrix sp. HDW6C]QIK69219.1 hypothetical protein G7062_02460 [Erysipelothrix sp. HDW6C]
MKKKKSFLVLSLIASLIMVQLTVFADNQPTPSSTTPTEVAPVSATETPTEPTAEAVEIPPQTEEEPTTPPDKEPTGEVAKPQEVATQNLEERQPKDLTISGNYKVTAVNYKLNDINLVPDPNEALTMPIKDGDELQFSVNWEIIKTDDEDFKPIPGDTISIDLPPGFVFNKDVPLSQPKDDLGTYRYDEATQKIVFTFGQGILTSEMVEDFKGNIMVGTKFNVEENEVNKIIDIIHPVTHEKLVEFTVTPTTPGSPIKKSALTRDTTAKTITWVININEDYQDLTNVKVTDMIPAGLTVDSVMVNEYAINAKGSVISEGTPVDMTSEWNVTGNLLTFEKLSTPRKIVITTTVDESQLSILTDSKDFTNKATLESTEFQPKDSNEVKQTFTRESVVVKSGSTYNKADRTFEWNVTLNPSGINLPKDALFTDRISPIDTFDYQKDSFKINVNGTDYSLAAFEAQFADTYAISFDSSGNGFDVKYLKPTTDTLKINYKTQVREEMIHKLKDPVSNRATLSIDNNGDVESVGKDGSGTGYGIGIASKNATIDYSAKKITWTVGINDGNHSITNIHLNDKLVDGAADLTYVPTSFVLYNHVTNTKTPVTPVFSSDKKSYTLDYSVIEAPATANYSLTYDTTYTTLTDNSVTKQRDTFSNHVDVTLTTTNKKIINQEATATVPTASSFINNGKKTGSYDFDSKELTWVIYLNFNGHEDITRYNIADVLLENQKFLLETAKAMNYTVNPDGSTTLVDGSSVQLKSGEHFTLTENNSSKDDDSVSFNFNESFINSMGAKPQRIAVEFKTSMDDKIIPEKIKNVAVVTTNKQTTTVDATVDIPNGGNFSEKSYTVEQVNGKPAAFNWTIVLNKSNSDLTEAKITDTLSNNHTYDQKSLEVYGATVKSDGTVIQGTKLIRDTNYKVTFNEVQKEGEFPIESFDLEVLKISDLGYKSFIVKYKTVPLFEEGKHTFKNNVAFNGSTTAQSTVSDKETSTSSLNFGGGSVDGSSQTFTIEKVGADGKPLSGVQFELYFAKSGKFAARGTTDSKGLVTLKPLLTGDYILKEVKTVDGYGIPANYRNGVAVRVSKDSSAAGVTHRVTNVLNEIKLTKTSSTNQKDKLIAVFEVYEQATDGTRGKLMGEFTTNSNGQGSFNNNNLGLLPGTYIVKEKTAIAGHILNPTEFKISVKENILFNEDGSETINVVNHKGSVKLTKLDGITEKAITSPISFKLYRNTTELIGVYPTKNGIIEIKDALAPSDYTFVEETPSHSYLRNEDEIKFTIPAAASTKPATVNVTAKNYSATVNFTKYDGNPENDKTLSGATFAVYRVTPGTTPTYDNLTTALLTTTSQTDGKVSFTPLGPGSYVIKETQAAPGYVLSKTLIPFTIADNAINAPITININEDGFANYQGSVILRKVDGGVSDSITRGISGTEFALYTGEPQSDESLRIEFQSGLMSRVDGVITVEGLAPGKYYFVEKVAAPGYFLDATPIPFEIKESVDHNNPVIVDAEEFANYKMSATFNKTDGINGLGGAEFALEKDGVLLPDRFVSDDDGYVTFTNLGPGSYVYYETVAAPGYVLRTEKFSFELDTLKATKAIKDISDVVNYKGSASLKKVDETGTPLEDAEYSLFATNGDLIRPNLTTNSDGLISVTDLSPGDYYFQETAAPEGFILNTEHVTFTISAEAEDVPETVNVTQTNFKADVFLTKVTEAGTNLEGAEFTLYDADGTLVATDVSKSDGAVSFQNLSPGSYTIQESNGVKGYIVNTQVITFLVPGEGSNKVNIDLGDVVNYQGSVNVTKIDDKGKTIGEAVFNILDENKEVLHKDVITVNGKLAIGGLEPGSYFIQEVKAPKGYLLSKKLAAFEIPEEFEGEFSPVEIRFANTLEPIVLGVVKKPKPTQETNLPGAGVSNMPLFMGMGSLLMGSLIVFVNRKKKF